MLLYLTLHLPLNTCKPMQSVSAAIAPPSRSTMSKYASNHPRSQPQSAFLSSLDLSLHGHIQTRLIIASQCISEFTQSWSPIASPKSLDHHLQKHLWVHWISVSKCISKLARSWSPSASQNLLNHGLPVQLWVSLILVSSRISKFVWSWPQSSLLWSYREFMFRRPRCR